MDVFKAIRIIFWILAAALVVGQGCSSPPPPQAACGFVQNSQGQRVGWNGNLPIKMELDQSVPQQYYQDIQNAMDTWETAIGHTVFVIDATGTTYPAAQDGHNVIYWMSNWDITSIDQQANTTLYWVDNQITEADIRVDSQNFVYSDSTTPGGNQVDIESLMIHELGHVLGRIHETVNPSVMAPSLASGILRRTLFPVDISDVQCEY